MRIFTLLLVSAMATACGPPAIARVNAPSTTTYISRIDGRTAIAFGRTRVPFAHYINSVHRALHPHFSDKYLASHDALSPDIQAEAEVVIDGRTGNLVQTEIVASSGATEFDEAVLRSLKASFPIVPPAPIHSDDGLVYLRWRFSSDRRYACNGTFARPYLLAAPTD